MNSMPAMVAIALAIVVALSIALTLTMEGAGALFMRDQIRAVLKRSRATIQAQQPTATEDVRVSVLH